MPRHPSNGNGPPIPPKSARVMPRVLRPEPGKPLDVVIVNDRWDAYYVHPWMHPLTGEFVRCDLCLGRTCTIDHRANLTRWVGLLACQEPATWKRCIVMLTPEAARDLEALYRPPAELRGRRILVSRAGASYKGTVRVSSQHTGYYPQLAAPFDVGPALRAIWHLRQNPADLVDYSAGEEGGAP